MENLLLKHQNTERNVYMFLCFSLSTNQVKSIKNKLPKTQRLKCQKPKQCCFITYGQILIENATQKEFLMWKNPYLAARLREVSWKMFRFEKSKQYFSTSAFVLLVVCLFICDRFCLIYQNTQTQKHAFRSCRVLKDRFSHLYYVETHYVSTYSSLP